MFSLLIKYSFIYEFLAIIALFNLELKQLDVKITFLYGELKDKIYMR